MLQLFLLAAYLLLSYLKKCFYSDFGPLQLRTEKTVTPFWVAMLSFLHLITYAMGKTCKSAPHRSLWLMFVVNIDSANKHCWKRRWTEAFKEFMGSFVIDYFLPVPHIMCFAAGCWFSFWACNEKVAKVRKAQPQMYCNCLTKKKEIRGNDST